MHPNLVQDPYSRLNRDGKASGLLEGQRAGLDGPASEDGVLGESVGSGAEHRVADLDPADPCTYLVDHARGISTRPGRQGHRHHLAHLAGADLPVDAVHAGGADLDADLPVGRVRLGNLD